MATTTAGVLMIAGSAIFLVGAAIGVPRIFTEPDREQRLRMLEERIGAWRLAQPFYALGPMVASVGVGTLAAGSTGSGRFWFAVSGLLLVAGALSWSWSVYLRTTRYREFALGGLPDWPFVTYVALTLAGIASLGIGVLTADVGDGLGWVIIGADIVYTAAYIRFKDIPPFVFYLLLLVVGVVAL